MGKAKCSPCKDDGKDTDARKYCKECKILLCENCLDMHGRILKNHTLEEVRGQNYPGRNTASCNDIPFSAEDSMRPEPSAPPLPEEDIVNQMPKNTGYLTIGKKVFSVRIEGDLLDCHILGICQLMDGSIIVADNSNKKLKRLSTYCENDTDGMNINYYVSNYCDLPKAPFDVCCVGNEEVAVSISGNVIQFVKIMEKCMKRTRTLELKHDCYGLTFGNNLLHVGDGTNIFVYSLTGQQYPVLYSDPSSKSSASRFKLSDDGAKMFVVNYGQNHVSMFDTRTAFRTNIIQHLQGAKDVAVANNKIVFACGLYSNWIAQFGYENGSQLEDLGFLGCGIDQPQSLCFDRINTSLIVGQWKNDCMIVLFIN